MDGWDSRLRRWMIGARRCLMFMVHICFDLLDGAVRSKQCHCRGTFAYISLFGYFLARTPPTNTQHVSIRQVLKKPNNKNKKRIVFHSTSICQQTVNLTKRSFRALARMWVALGAFATKYFAPASKHKLWGSYTVLETILANARKLLFVRFTVCWQVLVE